MNNRTIHITAGDMQRLGELVSGPHSDMRDRPYLTALKTELTRATVVEPSEIPADVVTMNSQVRLRDGRRTWNVTLVFPEAADAELDQISVLAPLGAALLGCRAGQRVEFRVPGGQMRACDVLSIVYQPEAAGQQS